MSTTPFGQMDIVNSATPLETRFEGVHPRLYATQAEIEALRSKTLREPWASFLKRVIRVAQSKTAPDFQGDLRPYGDWLAHLAVAFRMTRDTCYLESARACIAAMAARADWTTSLQYGHWAHGMALAYDWLYDELDEPTGNLIRQTLADRTERVYRHLVTFADSYSVCYAWNHMEVVQGGFMAAGCALWGEVKGPGRWLRMGLEKLRLMSEALGPDGASAEGQAYGQYHLDFLLKSMLLADGLLGEDFFERNTFLRNYPGYMIHSMLPRSAWKPMTASRYPIAFVQTSDTDEVHWHGPDAHLRVVAKRYGDGRAQWLANETAAAGVCADSSCFLNLLCHDDAVVPVPPEKTEPFAHFEDKDLVLMRSGWGPEASLAVFKCGPNSGYHARRYRHNIAGGHMHPDAGHLMIHAFGEWLLRDDGYALKMTSYQNTVLVNGVGQTGEGGLWFEDLEMRRGKPEGRIVRAEHHPRYVVVTGDAAPAYQPEAGLKTFLRHVVYGRPNLWVVVDELEAGRESTFEQRFHGPAPFVPSGFNEWLMKGAGGALRVVTAGPGDCRGRVLKDPVRAHPPAYPDREIDCLAISNVTPSRTALFITVFQATPATAESALHAQLVRKEHGWLLEVKGPQPALVFIHPGQSPQLLA